MGMYGFVRPIQLETAKILAQHPILVSCGILSNVTNSVSMPGMDQMPPEMQLKGRYGVAQPEDPLADLRETNPEAYSKAEPFLPQIRAEFSVPGLDLGKEWHAIHYVLSGVKEPDDRPISWAVLGGKEIGDDLGYGPARLLDPTAVQQVATALEQFSVDKFSAEFDSEKLAKGDLYPGGWDPEEKDFITDLYRSLRELYLKASKQGQAVLLYLS